MARERGDRDYDYVVVGAGSGGAAVAARLSEDQGVTVALLEAGGRDANPWIHIPGGYYRNIYNPAITWQYGSGPEPHLGGRIVKWPRGKVLGGTSAINGLLYVRGQAEDYNHWRQLGNSGWSFEDVLPYFKRAERQQRGGDDLHGGEGPVGVSDPKFDSPISAAFIQSAIAEGIPHTRDFNGPSQEGVGYYQLTTWNGRRASTGVAYLSATKGRRNLDIITHAAVKSLVLDGKRVRGVRFDRNGGDEVVRARREVIVSGGAIGSPLILQASGIGPGAVLRKAGIPVVHDLPGVGENLQDHYQARYIYEVRAKGSLNEVWHSNWLKLRAGVDYLFRHEGPLTVGAGFVGIFAKSRPDLETPDVQFHYLPLSLDAPGLGLHDYPGVIASVCQLRPESRGHIHITSPDPTEHPEIISNYLAVENDRAVMLAALKLARRIAARPPFADLVVRERVPGPAAATDEALMAFARETGTTIFHPCGTCKMGQDRMAVVDERLRVRGLEGLRVADAAIMPTMVSGNTNAPTIMIGEKAAAMIAEDARKALAA
jgi:choline dehydrogenase